MHRGLAPLTFLLVASSCLHPPPPPPAPPAAHVPPGCEASLEGWWVLEADPTFGYRAIDDGGAVELRVFRSPPRLDAGFRPRRFRLDAGASDAGAFPDNGPVETEPATLAVIVLERTPAGFLGVVRSPVSAPDGGQCEATFHTELLSCDDGGLTVRAEASVAIDHACETGVEPAPSGWVEHHLVKHPGP